MAQKIDIKTVEEVAHLARLEFSEEGKVETGLRKLKSGM